MNLQNLESFYYVATKGGFSHAALYLEVSKGLISRHIRALEEELNCQLFHRSTRSVTLTEAGQHLLIKAEQIFVLANSAQQQVQDLTQDAKGLIRFTSPVTLGEKLIGDILPSFHRQCPKVDLELNFSTSALQVETGEQDIALRAFEVIPDNLVAKQVGKTRNVLVASLEYIKEFGQPDAPLDIYRHQCISNSHKVSWNHWKLVKGKHTIDLDVKGHVSTNEYSTARILALHGEGIANLPYYLVEDDLAQGKLINVLADFNVPVHELHIVHAAQRLIPKKMRIFKSLLSQWFEDHPQYLSL